MFIGATTGNVFDESLTVASESAGTVVDGPTGSSGGKVQLHGVEYDKVV